VLLEALRQQLAGEGRPPSRARLAALIEAGAVRVDGRVVRDPTHPLGAEVRLSFDPDEADPVGDDAGPGARGPLRRRAGAAARPPLPTGVLFADAQVVVVERAAFPQGAEGFASAVAAALGRERLWVPRDPSAPGAGPVLLAGSEASRKRLEALLASDGALETLLSVRTPVTASPYEVVVEQGVAGAGRPPTPFALLRREQAPPGPPPLGARQVVPPQRLALAFKHPRTNRRLELEVGASPTFLQALVGLGLASREG
jgi:hypothetical protein